LSDVEQAGLPAHRRNICAASFCSGLPNPVPFLMLLFSPSELEGVSFARWRIYVQY
jgi:hypothetical protein